MKNLNRHAVGILVVCAVLLAGNGLLQWLVDDNLGVCWTHNVLRNWQEFGLFALKGQLVINPGGHEALTHPTIYSGHRPTSLYPAYLSARFFRWTGFGALPYHLLVTIVIWISIWYLLGRTGKGWLLGAVAILTPGFIEEPTLIDPNAVAILAGLPYAALLWWQLRQPQIKSGAVLLLAATTLAFTILNWTTALIHAQILVCLIAVRAITPRRWILYALAGAAAAVVVVALGLISKLSGGAQSNPGTLNELLRSYLWGRGGYGGYSQGLSTGVLLGRVAAINVVALLPIWLLWVGNWFLCLRKEAPRALRSLAPLAVAGLETVGMRNYFAHLPWMAAPLLLVGCVFSFMIMTAPAEAATLQDQPGGQSHLSRMGIWKPARLLGIFATFGFALAVLCAVRVHNGNLLSLVAFIRQDTNRRDDIVISAERDPRLASIADRLDESFDRRVTLVNTFLITQKPRSSAILLTGSPLENGAPLAGKSQARGPSPLIGRTLEWFSRHVIRRKSGDQMEVGDTYYLYRLSPSESGKVAVTQ